MSSVAVSAPTDQRRSVSVFIAGAAGTTIVGLLVQTLMIPTTDVADDRWSYPWETGPFVAVSLLYALLHLAVVIGLVGFGRSGVAGTSRSARYGITLAVAGTLTLAVGELAGLPIGDALTDDTSAQVVGAVFGLGMLLSAIGLLMVGTATLGAYVWHDWRRYTPLATGIWCSVMLIIPPTIPKALPGAVAVYGVGLFAMAIGLHRDSANQTTGLS